MTNIQMAAIILTILVPMLSGFGWIVIRLFKMQKEVSSMHIELLKEIRGLDSRIAHIEGYLIGMGQKTGTEKK